MLAAAWGAQPTGVAAGRQKPRAEPARYSVSCAADDQGPLPPDSEQLLGAAGPASSPANIPARCRAPTPWSACSGCWRAGITSFIDLTEEGELPEYDTLLPELTERRVHYRRLAILDHSLPDSSAHMARILDLIDSELAAGQCVYLHCRAGIGRTGTAVGLPSRAQRPVERRGLRPAAGAVEAMRALAPLAVDSGNFRAGRLRAALARAAGGRRRAAGSWRRATKERSSGSRSATRSAAGCAEQVRRRDAGRGDARAQLVAHRRSHCDDTSGRGKPAGLGRAQSRRPDAALSAVDAHRRPRRCLPS